MLSALPLAKHMGFTLVEVMVVITIILLVTMLGLPSYRTWLQNTQIRNAAESIQNGIQKAKAEAVKQNVNIEFVMGTSFPWKIEVANSGVIEISTNEGVKNVTRKATLADGTLVGDGTGTAFSDVQASATTVTFSSLGEVTANANGTSSLRQIDLDSSVLPAADSRNLTVTIGKYDATTHVWTGSNTRMCDPDPGLVATDPRKC